MTAELRRGLLLAAVGVVSGFAIVVAVFGPGEIMKRARSVVSPAERPVTLSDKSDAPGARPAEPQRDTKAVPEAPSDAKPDKQAALPKDLGIAPSEKPPTEPKGAKDGPSLDIVRVEPNGDTVIAGRAAPNASVEILRDNMPIARGKANESGEFAIDHPALPTGSSELTVRTVTPDGEATQGKESVAVVVDANRKSKPLVAISAPDKPTKVVSLPDGQAEPGKPQPAPAGRPEEAGKIAAAVPPPAAAKPGRAAIPVKVVSVDAQDGGRLDVSAKGNPAATLRLYLNDTMVASGQAAPDGSIAFTIGKGVRPGGYQVRVDQVDPNTGKVEHRAQVAFAMPETGAAKVAKVEPPPASGRTETAKTPLPGAKPDGGSSPHAKIEPSTPPAPRTEAPKAAPKLAQSEPSVPARSEMTRPLPSVAKPESAPAPATPAAPEASGTRLPATTSALMPNAAGPDRRSIAETPAVAAAAGRPEAAKPNPETDGRTAAALSPVLPSSAKPAPPAAIAETPSASLPVVPAPEKAQSGAAEAFSAGPPSSVTTEAAPVPPNKAGTVFVAEINTAKITRGDNLWQISRKSYGSGFRYTVIFDANKDQIRDPDLIYPGQIFVLPKDAGERAAKRG